MSTHDTPEMGFPVVVSRRTSADTGSIVRGQAERVGIRHGIFAGTGWMVVSDPSILHELGLTWLLEPAGRLFPTVSLKDVWSFPEKYGHQAELLKGHSGQLAALLALCVGPRLRLGFRPGLLGAGGLWITGALTSSGAVTRVEETDFVTKLEGFLNSSDRLFLAPHSNWLYVENSPHAPLLQRLTLWTMADFENATRSQDWTWDTARAGQPRHVGVRLVEDSALMVVNAIFTNDRVVTAVFGNEGLRKAEKEFARLLKSLRRAPGDEEVLTELIASAHRLNDWKEVAAELRDLIEDLPGGDQPEYAASYARMIDEAQSDRSVALRLWKLALPGDRTRDRAQRALIASYRESRNYDDMMALLKTRVHATDLDEQTRCEAWEELAILAQQRRQHSAEIEGWLGLLGLRPDHLTAWSSIARHYGVTSEFALPGHSVQASLHQGAQAHILSCVATDPTISRCARWQTFCGAIAYFAQLDDATKVLALVELAPALTPATEEAARMLCDLAERTPSSVARTALVDQGIALWEELRCQTPDHPDALRYLTDLYERRDAAPELADVLRAQADGDRDGSEQVEMLCRLAQLEGERLNQPLLATATWLRVLALAPLEERAIAAMVSLHVAARTWDDLTTLLLRCGRREQLLAILEVNATHPERTRDERRMLLHRIVTLRMQSPEERHLAVACLETIVELDPRDRAALDSLAAIHENEDDARRLTRTLEQLLAIDPTGPSAVTRLAKLGVLYLQTLSEPASAFDAFQRLLTLDVSHEIARVHIERAALEAASKFQLVGEYEAVARICGDLLRWRPRSKPVRSLYEFALLKESRWRELAISVETSLAEARLSEHVGIRLRLAHLWEKIDGEHDRAFSHYREALARDPACVGDRALLNHIAEDTLSQARSADMAAQRVTLFVQAARMFSRLPGYDVRAQQCRYEYLHAAEDNAQGMEALAQLHGNGVTSADLAKTYANRGYASRVPQEAQHCLRQAAEIYGLQMGDSDTGIRLWRGLAALDPNSLTILDPLMNFAASLRVWLDAADVFLGCAALVASTEARRIHVLHAAEALARAHQSIASPRPGAKPDMSRWSKHLEFLRRFGVCRDPLEGWIACGFCVTRINDLVHQDTTKAIKTYRDILQSLPAFRPAWHALLSIAVGGTVDQSREARLVIVSGFSRVRHVNAVADVLQIVLAHTTDPTICAAAIRQLAHLSSPHDPARSSQYTAANDALLSLSVGWRAIEMDPKDFGAWNEIARGFAQAGGHVEGTTAGLLLVRMSAQIDERFPPKPSGK